MSQFRNVLFGIMTFGLLVSSKSHAGNDLNGRFNATYLGPVNKSTGINLPALSCNANSHCSFIRPDIVPPGQSRVAMLVQANVDNLMVHVELGIWMAEGCQPDPTLPDASGSGDLTLQAAGRYIISFRTEDLLPAGTMFSQQWQVSTTDMTLNCGLSYCVNSQAGPSPAPFDCDAP